MSDVWVYVLLGSYGLMAVLLIADELRHRFFQPPWACAKCGTGPLEANGPASMFDGRKGFQCPSCKHVMEAYRSKIVLTAIVVMALAITAGCGSILLLNWNPDQAGLTLRPVVPYMYAGVIMGPIAAVVCLVLMNRPMPVRWRKTT